MLTHVLTEIREAQVPLLSAMLLGGSATKVTRALRVGSLDAGLGPTALFPMRLRRRVALSLCAAEFICGMALIVTAGRFGRGEPATGVRIATTLLFLVATCSLLELRANHPDVGCGCFGEFSTSPVSGRTLSRSAFLSVAALATIGLPPLQAPHPGVDAARLLGIFAVEFLVIAALSPELGEALVRLGYSEPCELRRLPAVRTLAALRRSSQWRRRAGLITAEVPLDMWRELCWRYVVFPARLGEREAEVVFAVHLRPHRPVIHAALVDSATGDVLAWPTTATRRGAIGWLMDRPFGPGRLFGRRRAGLAGSRLAGSGDDGRRDRVAEGRPDEPDVPAAFAPPRAFAGRRGPHAGPGAPRLTPAAPGSDDERAAGLLRIPAGMLAAPTDPGRGIPAIRGKPAPPSDAPGPPQPGPPRPEPPQPGQPGSPGSPESRVPPRTPPDDLPFSSDL
jgi:hypothetical protein